MEIYFLNDSKPFPNHDFRMTSTVLTKHGRPIADVIQSERGPGSPTFRSMGWKIPRTVAIHRRSRISLFQTRCGFLLFLMAVLVRTEATSFDQQGISSDLQLENYNWGPWGHVTSCTRTCGLGIRYRRRVCYRVTDVGMELSETPTFCEGPDRKFEVCPGLQECETEEEDSFRNQQCAAFNDQPYKGRLHRWKPYKKTPGHIHAESINPCALVCCANDRSTRHIAVRFSTTVRDGTLCDFGLTHLQVGGVCINGSCTRVGCDGVLYSPLVTDRCGVCGGNNNSCTVISGNVSKDVKLGYTNIISIPPRASNIRVIETVDTSAVFAVRNDDGILFVNGRSSESYPTVYRHVDGVVFRYHHVLYSADGRELLEGFGRTNQTLYIMMLQPETSGHIRVYYEYSFPISDNSRDPGSDDRQSNRPTLAYEGPPVTTERPQFVAERGQLESQDTNSAHTQHSWESQGSNNATTRQTTSLVATTTDPSTYTGEDNSTDSSIGEPDIRQPGESVPANTGTNYRNPETNTGPFTYFWKVNQLAPCSATCTSGVQSRYSQCYRSDNVVVDNTFCEDSERPKPVNVLCEGRPCNPRWVASLWSSCSVSCGTGQQYRTVHCWRMMAPGFDSTVHDYLCNRVEKPFLTRSCKEVDCGPLWETSQWGECTRRCDEGIQTRNVRCSSQTQPCDFTIKPQTSRPCTLGPCLHKWIVSEWEECSGDCDNGIRKRSVTCRDADGNFLHDKYCKEHTRPLSVEACSTEPTATCRRRWVPQDWGVCSVDCDWGVTTRSVVCGMVQEGQWRRLEGSACRELRKPRRRATCREPPCKARWYTTDWSQCSKSCGDGGVRVRKVACYRDNKLSHHCDSENKPNSTDLCQNGPCVQEADGDRST